MMLILGRKPGQAIFIGDDVKVTLVDYSASQAKFHVLAPKSIGVHREEIYRRLLREKGFSEQQAKDQLFIENGTGNETQEMGGVVLTRRYGEALVIGKDIKVRCMQIDYGLVRVGIEAPRGIEVHREEIYEKIHCNESAEATQKKPKLRFKKRRKITADPNSEDIDSTACNGTTLTIKRPG